MAQTEQRLGFRPPYGAWDTAFDAFYVHDPCLFGAPGTAKPATRKQARREP